MSNILGFIGQNIWRIGGGLAILGAVLFGYYIHLGMTYGSKPDFSVRFRMTVDVEVEGVIKSGSSVVNVAVYIPDGPGSNPRGPRVRNAGEAVYIDLGQGRNLFALLWFPNYRYGDPHGVGGVFARAFKKAGIGNLTAEGDHVRLEALVGKRETVVLDFETMPQFISFDDMSLPGSVRMLNPQDDSFQSVLGPKVRFMQVRIELVKPGQWPHELTTGEPIVYRFDKLIPWASSVDGQNDLYNAMYKDPRRPSLETYNSLALAQSRPKKDISR
jgi:hypothetical protein